MASIYVSMPSMMDYELIPTLKSCIHQASRNNSIKIGVAFSTFYENINIDEIVEEINKIDCVEFKHFSRQESLGVGAARKNAHSFYDGQDYLLQIDSHSFFKKNWDIELIKMFKESNLRYGKSVLTGYPPSYRYSDSAKTLTHGWSRVSTSVNSGVLSDSRSDEADRYIWDFLPNWSSPGIVKFSEEYEQIPKISAGFIFGDKNFAQNYLDLIPYNYFFFEEEIIMTIELLSKKYNLIAPSSIPIAHLYSTDMDENCLREGISLNCLLENKLKIKHNFYDYCYNNIDKVLLLNQRLNIDLFDIINKSRERLNKNDS